MAKEPYPGERPKNWSHEGKTGESSRAKTFGIVLAVFVGLGVIASVTDDGALDQSEDNPEAVVAALAAKPIPAERRVTAADLSQRYADNEVSAQAFADGGPLHVSGKIEAIELDFSNDPVVRLVGHEPYSYVSVPFEKSSGAAIGTLKKGQNLEVDCLKVTEVLGTPHLRDCTLAP